MKLHVSMCYLKGRLRPSSKQANTASNLKTWFTRLLFPCNCCSLINKGLVLAYVNKQHVGAAIKVAERHLLCAWWAKAVHIAALGRRNLPQIALNCSWARCRKACGLQWEPHPCQNAPPVLPQHEEMLDLPFPHIPWSLGMEIQGNSRRHLETWSWKGFLTKIITSLKKLLLRALYFINLMVRIINSSVMTKKFPRNWSAQVSLKLHLFSK